MRKILIAPDSFKESLSATEVANAIEAGVLNADHSIKTVKLPMADGGEGTLAVIHSLVNAKKHNSIVNNALGSPIDADWLQLTDTRTAVIEVAQSIGLAQLNLEDRNPLLTSSFGVGQHIQQALDAGVENITIALGGSATNDAGAGLLQALGAEYYDNNGQSIRACGGNLNVINSIDFSNLDTRLAQTNITLLCDVSNVLCGEHGASAVFAPQKGASKNDVRTLDNNLIHFSALLEQISNKHIAAVQGAGAAGGIPAALLATTNAQIQSGIDYVLELTQFSTHLSDADWVITGEGKIDHQTLNGKVIAGIADRARVARVPVIALGGCVDINSQQLRQLGLRAAFSICHQPMSLKQALQQTETNLISTSENIMRLILQKDPE